MQENRPIMLEALYQTARDGREVSDWCFYCNGGHQRSVATRNLMRALLEHFGVEVEVGPNLCQMNFCRCAECTAGVDQPLTRALKEDYLAAIDRWAWIWSQTRGDQRDQEIIQALEANDQGIAYRPSRQGAAAELDELERRGAPGGVVAELPQAASAVNNSSAKKKKNRKKEYPNLTPEQERAIQDFFVQKDREWLPMSQLTTECVRGNIENEIWQPGDGLSKQQIVHMCEFSKIGVSDQICARLKPEYIPKRRRSGEASSSSQHP